MMMMVMPRVKSLSTTQHCYKLVCLLVSPTSLRIFSTLQELVPYNVFFQVSSHFFALQFSMLLPLLQVSTNSQVHFPHSYCNTHHKSQIYYKITSNATFTSLCNFSSALSSLILQHT